ncbi:DUF3019 domain-containing protein [Shewanella maritima]|uniref:DUF3019 domain-containing protein n=1 Tax=Shewanella maritima TaxID=2520507 RepID=UPI003736040D
MQFINNSFRFCQLIIILLLFLSLGSVYADTLDGKVKLTATPEFCLTDAEEQFCEMDIVLNWEMASEQLVCILSDYEAMPRWCSTDSSTRSLNLRIQSDKDINFVLVNKNNNTLGSVKINITKSSATKVRRRYRNPWSLF